jgi:hypothetical protein
VNYVVLDFGVFVCNTCSGIHRELNHKVKGMGMSNFNEKDVEKIQSWGNAKAKKYWMGGHNKTLFALPDRRDLMKMKEFMKMKYVQKRFVEQSNDDSSDSEDESSDEDKKKQKKKKKAKKAKKTKKKKKSSSSDDSESEDKSEEEKVEAKPVKKVKISNSKLQNPSAAGGKLGKPKATVKVTQSVPKKEPKAELDDIFGLDFGNEPSKKEGQTNKENGSGWAAFESGSSPVPPQATKPESDELWGVFDNNAISEKKTNSLLDNLGDLYGKAAQQQQQQQFNQFPQYGQKNVMPTAGNNNYGYSMPTPQNTAPQENTNTGSSDPFASVFNEQQKQHFANNQAQNAPSPGGNNGVTPNMFFQQMMSMMQNSNGNQQQNAMMMATMQNMMQQMAVKNPQGTNPEPQAPEPESLLVQTDPSNGAFKSLFNNAAQSTTSGAGSGRYSHLASQNNGAFGNSTFATESQKVSEPANPFGNFGSSSAPPMQMTNTTSQSNNLGSAQFPNSGWSSSEQPVQNNASSNPFDMFK